LSVNGAETAVLEEPRNFLERLLSGFQRKDIPYVVTSVARLVRWGEAA
jgi:hypothetical protein